MIFTAIGNTAVPNVSDRGHYLNYAIEGDYERTDYLVVTLFESISTLVFVGSYEPNFPYYNWMFAG